MTCYASRARPLYPPSARRSGLVRQRASAIAFAVTAALAPLTQPSLAAAQTYPTRPIKMLVDGPAGGINDIWTRRYTQRLTEGLGQSIVVENRPGASGSIAAEALSKAPNDGYTMMYGGMNPLVAFPSAGGVVRYDPVKDFAPAALGLMGYPAFVASAKLGVKTLAELQQYARSRPEGLTCGTSGQAGVQHFCCAMVERALGIKMQAVHYKGGSAALQDAAAGQIDVSVGYTSELLPYTVPGKVVPLASFAPIRLPKFAEAPSFGEAGFPNMEMPSFSGFFMPAGAPKEAIERFNAAAAVAMSKPEMIEWRESSGGFYKTFTPVQFGEFVRGEQAKWRKMSEDFGIRAESGK